MRYHWYMALKGLKINKVRIEGKVTCTLVKCLHLEMKSDITKQWVERGGRR